MDHDSHPCLLDKGCSAAQIPSYQFIATACSTGLVYIWKGCVVLHYRYATQPCKWDTPKDSFGQKHSIAGMTPGSLQIFVDEGETWSSGECSKSLQVSMTEQLSGYENESPGAQKADR
ncbi:hypothetical protein TURU_066579 [Turdus rufiventris]|nr:hypothetical protein TURU_066579 [Turdus rufiventris]